MKNVFKIIVVALLSVIITIQLTYNNVGRYKLNTSENFVFDTKTGKIFSPSDGIFDMIEISKTQQEAVELRKKREDTEKEKIEKAKMQYYNDELPLSDFIQILKTYKKEEVEKVEHEIKLKSDLKRKDIDRLIFLSFERDKEVRALKILEYYGDIFDEENSDVFNQMDKLDVFDLETYKKYNEMRDK